MTNTRPVILNLIINYVVILIIIFCFNDCKKSKISDEIRQTDTLIKWTKVANETMVIDPDIISNRIDSIKIKTDLIKKNNKSLHNEVIVYHLNEYEGIYSRYKSFLERYEALEYDNIQFTRQLEILKKRLIDNQINKTEFNNTYPILRKKISNHLAETRKLVGTIGSLEEMYNRVNNFLTDIYNNMKSNQKQ